MQVTEQVNNILYLKKVYECIISANKFLKKEKDTEKIEILATTCCHEEFKQKRPGSKKGQY